MFDHFVGLALKGLKIYLGFILDAPYPVRYKENQRSNISSSDRNSHYSTQAHKSKTTMKSPKNTLTIEDTNNAVEKFNKYNENQKNESNIGNSFNLDTSFNSSLDYDIGNNLGQNNKINSERRSARLEEMFQNDYRNPNQGRNTREHFAGDNKVVRKDLIETGKKAVDKTDRSNKKVNEHVDKDISELKKERMRLIRNQKERESSIKDTSNQSDEEGSILEKFNKYREAQKNLKSNEDIERYAVPVNIQNTNEVDIQYSKSSERKSLPVKDSVDSEINDLFDNSRRSRMTLGTPSRGNVENLQKNRPALRTREGILRQNAEDTTRLNYDRDRLRKESQNNISVPSENSRNSSRLEKKEVNEENLEDIKKQGKKLNDISESVKKVPTKKDFSSSSSRVKSQSNESLSKSQERLDQEIEKLYNDRRLLKRSDDRLDKSLKNIEGERINDFQNFTDEIFDEEEMRKKTSKSHQNFLEKDIDLGNNNINRHKNKTFGKIEGSPHQREKRFANTKVDKHSEGNINKHNEGDVKIKIGDSSRIEDWKKDREKMIGYDIKLSTVHPDQLKPHKADENEILGIERIKDSSTPRKASFNTREAEEIVANREHSVDSEDRKPYNEMERFSYSRDKQYKESKKTKHHHGNGRHDENEDPVYYAEEENHRRNYNRGFLNEVRDGSINGSSVNRSRQLNFKNIEPTKTTLNNEDECIKNYDRHSNDKMIKQRRTSKLQIDLDENEINLDQSADRRNTLDDLFAAEDYKKIKGKQDISLTSNTSRETLSSIQELSARKSEQKIPEQIFEKKGKYLEEDTEGEYRGNRTTPKSKMLRSDFDDTETRKRSSSRERPVPAKMKSHDNDHMTPKIKRCNSATKLKRESSFTSKKFYYVLIPLT